jgi:hypothetical protein
MHKIGLRFLAADRSQEKQTVRKDNPQILFISTIYKQFPAIVSAMQAQSYQNWKLWMIHDGPVTGYPELQEYLDAVCDHRVSLTVTPERKQQFGHPMRKWALEELKSNNVFPDSQYVVITNSDNYFLPVYCEYMLNAFKHEEIKAVYCDMLHNYFGNVEVRTEIKLSRIDIAAVMFDRVAVAEEGWNSMEHSSDWTLIEAIANKHGMHKFRKVPGTLVVHN